MKVVPYSLNNEVGKFNWGTHVNGSWKGVLGLIDNGTVDTACLFYQRLKAREKYFDFSYTVTNVKPSYVVRSRADDFSSAIWNAYIPYATSTWLTMALMFLVQIFFCIFVTKVEIKMGRRQKYQPLKTIWKLVRLQLYQPDKFDYMTAAGNFSVLVFAILQCRLLLDMYQTLLLSALLQSTPSNPFTNIQEMIKLIADKKYHLITSWFGNAFLEELYKSNISHFRSLRNALGENSVQFIEDVERALDMVQNENYIFQVQLDSHAMHQAEKRCKFAFVSKGLPQVPSHFVFRKNYPFLQSIYHAILMNQDFVDRTYRK